MYLLGVMVFLEIAKVHRKEEEKNLLWKSVFREREPEIIWAVQCSLSLGLGTIILYYMIEMFL